MCVELLVVSLLHSATKNLLRKGHQITLRLSCHSEEAGFADEESFAEGSPSRCAVSLVARCKGFLSALGMTTVLVR